MMFTRCCASHTKYLLQHENVSKAIPRLILRALLPAAVMSDYIPIYVPTLATALLNLCKYWLL